MASYRIPDGGITESVRQGDLRTIVPIRVIRYYVGSHGPFQYQTDAKDYTPEGVAAELEKQAQAILKVLGG